MQNKQEESIYYIAELHNGENKLNTGMHIEAAYWDTKNQVILRSA
jgi:hypothetical protein